MTKLFDATQTKKKQNNKHTIIACRMSSLSSSEPAKKGPRNNLTCFGRRLFLFILDQPERFQEKRKTSFSGVNFSRLGFVSHNIS